MKNHKLKTHPKFFRAVARNEKTFEIRKNDRNFRVGDVLTLQEWNPETEKFTGAELDKVVTYIFHGGQFGIEKGICVLGIGDPP